MLAKLKQFFAPPQFPEDDEKARIANLLNTLLWMFFLLFSTLTIILHFVDNDPVATISFAVVSLVNLPPLFLLHRRQVAAASWLTIGIFYLGTAGAAAQLSGLNLGVGTSFMMLILLAGLLLGRSVANVLAVISLIVSGVLLQLEASGQLVPIGSPLSNALSFGANIVLLAITLNLTLRDLYNASNRMRQSNRQLLDIQMNLERTVAARTRDLELAADVGRSASQIRELNTLLQNAVNNIQERFGLYYVQIYLADENLKTLLLKAGTGIVGRQLARRSHSLPFSSGSVNGIAATEKRTVLVADTAVSPIFKPNPLLPFTRSEMSVPLLVGNKVVGVLNLQSDQVAGLSEDNLTAFETLAGQIAIAIENAHLFTESTQARAEVETYLQFMTKSGWDNFQDAIARPEVMGITYENGTIRSVTDAGVLPAAQQNSLNIPITVANTVIGTIQLEADDTHLWSEEEKELVTAVAKQVGQQAENIRLLSEMDRYRTEAELAARRLSGAAWRDYLQQTQENVAGFTYSQDTVGSFMADNVPEQQAEPTVNFPVKVQEATIGEFVVSGVNQEKAETLIAAVSAQLGSHIENLRLARQTEAALAQTERLYRIGHELNSANSVDDILQAVLAPIIPTGMTESTLMFIELDKQGKPESLEILANWKRDDVPAYPVGTCFPLQQFPFTSLFIHNPDEPTLIENAPADDRVDSFTKKVMVQAGICAIAVIPLTMAGQWVGIITASWSEPHTFSKQEQEMLNALINLAAPAVQSQRLLAKTTAQADKEHLINLINQRIQSTMTVESALQTAVKELGQALHVTTKVKLNAVSQENQNHSPEAETVFAG